MLNKIWLTLIGMGMFAAVWQDVSDEIKNPYRNGIGLEVQFQISKSPASGTASWEGEIAIPGNRFAEFYSSSQPADDIRQAATITLDASGNGSFLLSVNEQSPAIWTTMSASASTIEKLSGTVSGWKSDAESKTATALLTFEPIRFVRLKNVTQSSLKVANVAVELAMGLIGIMALWLGLIKIAEEAGLVLVLTRLLKPVTVRLFPEVPAEHPAIGAIIMNTAANMLGLNNAATPMGLKAMDELNKLNPHPGTATNAMVTFLAINTAGLVLIPATAIAIRASIGSVNPGIIIGTSIVGAGVATVAGITASKLLQRLPMFKFESSAVDSKKEKTNE
jgi:spore maturation protein A